MILARPEAMTKVGKCANRVIETIGSVLNDMCEKACKDYHAKYEDEIATLPAEISELTKSQEFIRS